MRNIFWYGTQYSFAVSQPPPAADILNRTIEGTNNLSLNITNEEHPSYLISPTTIAETCLPPPHAAETEIQSLANDAATYCEYLDDEDSDAISHIIHTNSTSPIESLPKPGPSTTIPETHSLAQDSSNSSAISTQLQHQIHHDIGIVLPVLHGILNNLSNPGTHLRLENSEIISNFRAVLGSIEDSFAAEISNPIQQGLLNSRLLHSLKIMCHVLNVVT